MKLAIASDIHGSLTFAEQFFMQAQKQGAEQYVLLGDLYYHGVRNELPLGYAPLKVAELLNRYAGVMTVVKGNCDSDVDTLVSDFEFVSSAVIYAGGKKVFCTHGDKYDENNLPKNCGDVLVYGHYHTGFIKRVGNLIIANSGSVSLPKGGTERSFLMLDEEALTLYSLEGKVLAKEMLK